MKNLVFLRLASQASPRARARRGIRVAGHRKLCIFCRAPPTGKPGAAPVLNTLIDTLGALTMVRGSRHAPIAQLDRALVYGTKGRKFESSWAR